MSWILCKTNRFHFAVRLYSDNAQRTSKRGKNISHVLLCSYHVFTSSVRYQSTDARQNGIYLTNRFHFAVRLYSDNAQMTSKRGENKEVRYEPQASSVTDVLTTF